jgi:hypothetical protein
MTTVFPTNNLPTAAQPWAREVQKQLSNVIASDNSERINNTARDNQLNSSVIALSGVVADVKIVAEDAADAAAAAAAAATTANSAATNATNAINGLIGLGSDGSGYTLKASNITSGGVRDGVLTLTSGSNSSLQLFNGGVNINGPGAQIRVGDSGATGTTLEGRLTVLGGNFRAPGVTSTSFLQAENHSGGGTTGASINNNGTIIRTSSSERYKQDIEGLSVDYDDLLSLEPKRFRLKEEVAESEDARYYAGFIAEEIDQTSLKDFVAYRTMEDGSVVPDGVYYGELTAALLKAIKHQDTLIKSLTERVTILENKDKVE